MVPRHIVSRLVTAVIVVTAFALSACQKNAEKLATAKPTVIVDSVPSEDGLMIYYDVHGQGDRALVFVHCWSCDRTYWQNQVDEFAKDYRVVTVDLGGHGQSGMNRKVWTLAAFGADVAAVVNKLDLKNVVLIGHSMGGPVCIEAARRLQGRVVAIVGVDNFQNFGDKLTKEEVDAWVAHLQPDFTPTVDFFVRSMFPAGADSSLVRRIAADMASAPPDVAISAITETLLYDYRAALAEVRVPIRTISSDEHVTDVKANAAIAASFAMKVMPGRGHFLQLEDPKTFNRLLHETLAEFWP
ncbi:MAG: alpha/beta hydrolase [candidate division Zixibacteria bacterium]|nr:alpha/beta hydrolase [candidate division Zixibacteria bacterium]